MDDLEALSLADDLRSAYPGRNVSDQAVNRWARQLRKMTAYEARKVVEYLTGRAVDPPSTAQINQALAEVRQKTMSPRFDPTYCVYADGVRCYNCEPEEGVVHGHLIEPAVAWHGLHHLARHFDGEEGQLELAKWPERCDCGYVAPEGGDFARVVTTIRKKLSNEYHSPTPRYREEQW